MSLLTNILLIASLFLTVALLIRTSKSFEITGMSSLFCTILFFGVWVVGDLIEQNASAYAGMLWGRNIAQIGVFLTPLSTLFFSIDYTANHKLKPLAYGIAFVQIVSLLLIFTDQTHHIMRASVAVVKDAVFGQAFAVESTKIGSALVAFNFCIPLISIATLVTFAMKVTAKLRRHLLLIISSMLLTFLLALLQSSVLSPAGIHIPIPVWNLPCFAMFSYAVLNDGFVGVTPTALSTVFEVIDQGIVVVNEHGRVIEFNRRASELMEHMSIGKPIKTGSPIMHYFPAGKTESTQRFSVDLLPTELKNAQRNQYLALNYHTMETRIGKLIGYVLVLTDITQLKVRAEIDSLTGSYNREGLVNAFTDLQNGIERLPCISALIVDMDDFKAINDSYGHLAGDVVLCDFVNIAKSLLTDKQHLGRLGGDEFVILLPTKPSEAAVLAEELRKQISQHTVHYMDYEICYTISIGIANCRSAQCTLSQLLHRADLALYEAKHQGKNRVLADSAPQTAREGLSASADAPQGTEVH